MTNQFDQLIESLADENNRSRLLATLQEMSEHWPLFLETWEGMVKQSVEAGWPEPAARSLVLASITGGPNITVFACLAAYSGYEEDEDDENGEPA